MKLLKQMLFLAAAGTIAAGCGDSDNSCTDAGCPDGATALRDGGADVAAPIADGPMLWGLTRSVAGDGGGLAPNQYTITGIANVKDDCAIGVAGLVGKTLPVIYEESTMTISIGDVQGSPPGPSLGSGKVAANMATLTRDNLSGLATAACYWHQKDVSKLTLTNHDKFTLDVTEDEDTFAPGCATTTPPPPAGGKCTSTWQWTLEIKK
jgi:hypothetical protein